MPAFPKHTERITSRNLCSALTAISLVVSVVVGTASAVAADSSMLDNTRRQAYSVPAGPLGPTLSRFALASGIALSFEPALTNGKQSAGLSGSYTAREAIDRLLAGSGLEVIRRADGSYGLRRLPANTPAAAAAAAADVTTLDTVTITGGAAPLLPALPEPYAGGQVARGGRVGLLGNLDFMDTPFSQASYTAELMENQQAQMMADVLVNDPSVRDSGRKFSQASNAVYIRGLSFGTSDASFNGLRGIFPNYRQPVEALERIEVLKGPNALLNGMGNSIAGDINLVPKRAGDWPLARLTAGYMSDSEYTAHVDAGRRFGENNAWGVRVNGVYRNGDTPIDEQGGKLAMGAAALDYRGDRLRVSLDLLHQRARLDNVSPFSFSFATPDIPRPPSSDSAILLGAKADHEESTAAFRAEYDFSDSVSGYVAAGRLKQRSDTVNTQVAQVQPDGSYVGTLSTDAYGLDNTNVQMGVHADFATGPLRHRLAITADKYHQSALVRESGRNGPGPSLPGNIYEPLTGQLPDVPTSGDWMENGSTVDRKSLAIADTLSFREERVRLIVGVRKQYVEQEGPARGGPIQYKENALTPMVGVVVKPWDDVALYANYIEGLLQGATVRDSTSPDDGMVFPPYKTKQYEAGLKKDFGHFATTLSVFQIAQPSLLVDPVTRLYSQEGEQRNRGVEWTVFGQPTPQISLIGGLAYVRAELTRTAGGVNQGNQAPAVPKLQANLGIDWHVPAAPGLTLGARVIRTGSAYLDAANTQRVGGWTRYDVSARYATRIAGKDVVLRGSVQNVFDKDYWIALSGGAALSAPRTFLLSASIDF